MTAPRSKIHPEEPGMVLGSQEEGRTEPGAKVEVRPRPGSKRLIREINEALVMDTVRRHDAVSRATISATTGLSPATVTGIVASLKSAGFLDESGEVRAAAGRPTQLLRLSNRSVRAIGVRLSPNLVDVVALNLNGDVVMTHTQPWQGGSPEHAADAIKAAIDQLESRMSTDERVIGVGVAVSGIVDHTSGFVAHSGSLNWEDVRLRELLTGRLGVPVQVDNYVNAYAISMLVFDRRAGIRDALIVNVGASIGMSLVIGGKIYRGANGTAGGLAHTQTCLVDSEGRPCHCGDTGCLETVASQWGIMSELARRGMAISPESLAADHHEPAVAEVLTQAGATLGKAVANAAKIFGPDQVLVALASSLRSQHLTDQVGDAFSHAYPRGTRPTPRLEVVTADDTSWAYGAGCEVLAGLFHADIEVESTT